MTSLLLHSLIGGPQPRTHVRRESIGYLSATRLKTRNVARVRFRHHPICLWRPALTERESGSAPIGNVVDGAARLIRVYLRGAPPNQTPGDICQPPAGSFALIRLLRPPSMPQRVIRDRRGVGRNWPRTGQELAKNWPRTGQALVRTGCKLGAKLKPSSTLVGARWGRGKANTAETNSLLPGKKSA